MKKLSLFICLLFAFANISAENSSHKERGFILKGATGFSSHNQMLGIAELEYSQQIKGNWFWGVSARGNFNLGKMWHIDIELAPGADPEQAYNNAYRNTVNQDIYSVNGMAYYRIPVAKDILFLRPGLGIGLAYHQIVDHYDNSSSSIKEDKVLPYINAELAWLLKLNRVYLKFSPTLILCPQTFSFSPIKLGTPTDVLPCNTDAGFNIGIGFNF